MFDIQGMVAKALIDINAVHFYEKEPFSFTSGTVSPVYVDCRKLISFPEKRRLVTALASILTQFELQEGKIDVVAGGETAGIPYAAWLADELNLPMIYVRKHPKGFGRLAQIEGDLKPDQLVLLVEDLLFDAQSKIHFCKAIREAEAHVESTLVVFDYAIPSSGKALEENGIRLKALTNWPVLLKVAREEGYFSAEQCDTIRSFLDDPKHWSKSRQ